MSPPLEDPRSQVKREHRPLIEAIGVNKVDFMDPVAPEAYPEGFLEVLKGPVSTRISGLLKEGIGP